MILHAGCVALSVDGLWRGVLLTGSSGSGKSDLTLRLLRQGWRLVADDRTRLWTSDALLFGAAPEPIAGFLEVRGLDVVRTPALRLARIDLEAEGGGEVERLPEPRTVERLGRALPAVRVSPLEASAPAKLRLALFAAVRRRRLDSPSGRRI